MNRWTSNVLAYLTARSKDHGDHEAALLLGAPNAPHRRGARLSKARSTWEDVSAGRKEARKRSRILMHQAVWDWNLANTAGPGAWAGKCDCGCGRAFRHTQSGQLDHWIPRSQGGPDTRENGWRLSATCHAHKTANETILADGQTGPAVGWNERRRAYCERAGIPFVERRKLR